MVVVDQWKTRIVKGYDQIVILASDACEQHPVASIEDLQLEHVFRMNIFSMLFMV